MATEIKPKGECDLVQVAKAFVESEVAPNAASWEQARQMAAPTLRRALGLGFGAMRIDPTLGGSGLNFNDAGDVLRVFARVDFPFAYSVAVHSSIAGLIADKGSKLQIDRFLSGTRTGQLVVSVCITEPHGGSDAAAMRLTARREGNSWRLNGRKAWITSAVDADLFLIYAQTDPEAGAAGIASFLVERTTPGFKVTQPYELIGCHSMGLAGIELTDCEVPDTMMLSPTGTAFKLVMSGIDGARTLVAAMCSGLIEGALNYAIEETSERETFGSKIIDNQGVKWMLADLATDCHISDLLFRSAANKLDIGERATLEAAHAKKACTRLAMNAAVQCMQLGGARGLLASSSISRHLSAAKAAQYLDGTTEVQNIVISRSLSKV